MPLPFSHLTLVTAKPTQIQTMQDVWDWLVSHAEDPAKPKTNNPHGFRLQYLTTLKSHCGDAPLCTIPSCLEAFDRDFPKAKKDVHPRPDLDQDLTAYKKWRQNCALAIKIATGAAAEKAALRARKDGWADLIDAVREHTKNGGGIHAAAVTHAVHLSDIGRRAGIEPWDLANGDILDRLETGFVTPADLQNARKAQNFLNTYRYLPEIAALLPEVPVPVFPTHRQYQALPDHIDAFVMDLIENAAGGVDEVMGGDKKKVTDQTKSVWRAALRHHVRTLVDCPVDQDLDYTRPITHLAPVNDPAMLFEPTHLHATMRRTRDMEHLPGNICHVSGYNYYSALMVVLSRNDLLNSADCIKIKESRFMRQGRELTNGMTAANEKWCMSLVKSPEKRKRFRNMHRLMMRDATAMIPPEALSMPTQKSEDSKAYREFLAKHLSVNDLARLRQLGTCAATCAIEYTGRPTRMANVLGLRLRGSQQNFFKPSYSHKNWEFQLAAHETKSGKKEPMTPLNQKMGGPQVLAWYLDRIRPLFEHEATSIYLFPAVQAQGKSLNHKTFDTWFQRAASSVKFPMTFHKWRHGYASLLLAASWNHLPHAAQMLGNTPAVCARNYGWIDEERIVLETQDIVLNLEEAGQ
jgi:hypothetical protein